MPIRTKDQIRSAALQILEDRGSGVRTDAGEVVVDVVDADAIEGERSSVYAEYLRRINSIAGWQSIVTDETFKQQLADALGIASDRLTADFARSIGAPPDLTSDVEALVFVDLSNFAATFNRPRRAGASATAIVRLNLNSGSPFTLARGATFRRGSTSSIPYDSTQTLSGVTPSVDPATGNFFVDVNVRCRIAGRIGNAIRGAINATAGTLTGVSSVKSITAATGGRERESNVDLLAALPLALSGSNIGTERGLLNFVLAQDGVEDAILVGPGDPLMTRTDAGGVDIYIVGSLPTTVTAVTVIGTAGESFTLPLQPVQEIFSVVDGLGALYFDGGLKSDGTADGGYAFVPDAGDRRGSARAHSQIVWAHPPPIASGPAAASQMTITYLHDALIRDLQRRIDEDPDLDVPSSDVLMRQSTLIEAVCQLQAVPVAGLSALGLTQDDVNTAISDALTGFFGALKLGQQADFSDALVVAAEATIAGVRVVDRVEGFAMGRLGAPAGFEDLTVAANEYLRLEDITFLV
jgi:hypothetical protein